MRPNHKIPCRRELRGSVVEAAQRKSWRNASQAKRNHPSQKSKRLQGIVVRLRKNFGAVASRRKALNQTHNLKVAGSNPAPATNPQAPENMMFSGALRFPDLGSENPPWKRRGSGRRKVAACNRRTNCDDLTQIETSAGAEEAAAKHVAILLTRTLKPRIWGSGVRIPSGAPLKFLRNQRFFRSTQTLRRLKIDLVCDLVCGIFRRFFRLTP